MSFSEFDVTRRTRKGNFLNQIDYLRPLQNSTNFQIRYNF